MSAEFDLWAFMSAASFTWVQWSVSACEVSACSASSVYGLISIENCAKSLRDSKGLRF